MGSPICDARESSSSYVGRRPELTALHVIVRENLETFLACVREERGKDLPRYVVDEPSAISGTTPPCGPEIRRKDAGPSPLPRPCGPVSFEKPLGAAKDGFTLHAATRAGALDGKGREALLQYVLRPPIAMAHVERGPDGLVRIILKRPYADGTTAIDMDPLSLLARLAAAVPAPRRHTIVYSGVLAPASKLRSRVVPAPPPTEPAIDGPGGKEDDPDEERRPGVGSRYWPYLALLKRSLEFEHLCPSCGAPLSVVALVTDPRTRPRSRGGRTRTR